VGVLSVSVFKASAETLSNKNATLEVKVTPATVATPSPETEVQYYLPYPGILPDHPLYFLKMIRDKIWLSLTADALKKAEVLLLFADKRLGAAKVLIEGNKFSLGLTTLEKAEKYLERVAGELEEAKKKGKEIGPLAEKLETASLKHEEIILGLAKNLTGEGKSALEKLLTYPQEILKKVNLLFE